MTLALGLLLIISATWLALLVSTLLIKPKPRSILRPKPEPSGLRAIDRALLATSVLMILALTAIRVLIG